MFSFRQKIVKEETLNVATHAIAFGLSVVGLIEIIILALKEGNIWNIFSYTIFGSTMVILYASSTIYHSIHNQKIKKIFQKIDHIAIFLAIAGTYTPITLGPLRGAWGWSLFGIIWGLAIAGIFVKIFFYKKVKLFSTIIYIAMGWLIVFAVKPMIDTIPVDGLMLILSGGIIFTTGTYIYSQNKIPYNHAIWHLFVMCGSICHYFAIYYFVK
ncbi:MAG: hemolysin III family protein [Bacteroidota bacterium]